MGVSAAELHVHPQEGDSDGLLQSPALFHLRPLTAPTPLSWTLSLASLLSACLLISASRDPVSFGQAL